MIPDKVRHTLQNLRKNLQHNVEIHQIKGGFYVYRASSVYDSQTKKPKKTTHYIGSITPDGIFKPKKKSVSKIVSNREIFEYANGMLAYSYIKDLELLLEKYTPYFKELVTMAIVKALDPKPLRLIASRWEKLDLSNQIDVKLLPKHLGEVLHQIGSEVGWWYDLFAELASDNDLIFYDLTAIITYSESIKLAEKGYNADHDKNEQIGVSMAFSSNTGLPIGCDVSFGSMRDIKTIKNFLNRFKDNDIGLILDRGFSSYSLLNELKKRGIHYLVPLKKNSKFLPKSKIVWDGGFLYRNRGILCTCVNNQYGYLYLYMDPLLKGEKESTLLKNSLKRGLNVDDYQNKCEFSGIIPILSDIAKPPAEIFLLYKEREDVELAFDALKNPIDSDKSYLQSEESVRGYFFISLLALRIYFSVLRKLRILNLNQIISVEEVFFELSKIEIIHDARGTKSFAQIPKRAAKMLSLFTDHIPMG